MSGIFYSKTQGSIGFEDGLIKGFIA